MLSISEQSQIREILQGEHDEHHGYCFNFEDALMVVNDLKAKGYIAYSEYYYSKAHHPACGFCQGHEKWEISAFKARTPLDLPEKKY